MQTFSNFSIKLKKKWLLDLEHVIFISLSRRCSEFRYSSSLFFNLFTFTYDVIFISEISNPEVVIRFSMTHVIRDPFRIILVILPLNGTDEVHVQPRHRFFLRIS